MLVKFFKTKNGGSIAGINYLLNHRVKDNTAFVLKGSEVITRQIVSNMTKKQKLCMGCLSFEEADIDLNAKQKIINEFETLIFGEYKERFNILWVQHIDKGRLELNFAIPKIDLESGMAFNPYYDKKDRALIDTWQNLANFKFNFSDPKDPAKAHMLQGSRKEIGAIKDYIELEKILTDKFINQEFACREDILKALEDSDIEVTRVGKDYISVKLPGTKKAKRFKGDIFCEEFRNIKSVEQLRNKTEARAAEFRDRADTQTNVGASRQSFIFARHLETKEPREFRIVKFKQSLSKRDQELARLKRELDKQIQERDKWLEVQTKRVPKRCKIFRNHIMDIGYCISDDFDIHMEPVSTKALTNANKSANDGIDKAKYKWQAINHKHTIFNERIFDNDSTRANIIDTIRRKREMGARYGNVIGATIDGIQDIKREISQYRDRINKQYKFLISRVIKLTTAANKLAERIRESDIFSRELHDATREFEEVARKYALSHAQKDVKIDVDVPKKRDIGGMGFDF